MKRTAIAKATLVLWTGLFFGAALSNGGGTGHEVVQGVCADDAPVVLTRGYNNPSAYIGHAEDATVNAKAVDEAAYEELRSAFGTEEDAAVLAKTARPEPGAATADADGPSPVELMGLMLTEETFADLNRSPRKAAEEALANAKDLNKALEPTAAGAAAATCK